MRCPLCGASNKACGGHTSLKPIDSRVEVTTDMAAVAIYEYTDDNGQKVRVKLSETDAKRLGAKKVGAPEAPKAAKTTAKKTTARTKKRTASNK